MVCEPDRLTRTNVLVIILTDRIVPLRVIGWLLLVGFTVAVAIGLVALEGDVTALVVWVTLTAHLIFGLTLGFSTPALNARLRPISATV